MEVCYQKASRLFYKINEGRISEPDNIKIKIPRIDDKEMSTL